MDKVTTHSPTTLLRASRMAFPDKQWYWDASSLLPTACPYPAERVGYPIIHFNPHDPTKGDLAALNEALEREGWRFYYLSASLSFAAVNEEFECTLYAPTPADRALKCVAETKSLDVLLVDVIERIRGEG